MTAASSTATAARQPGEDTSAVPVIRSRRNQSWPVVVVALLVGLLFGLPHILMPLKLRAQGKFYAPLVCEGITALTYDEISCYAARITNTLDGHLFSADFHGWEHKDDTPYLGQSWLDSVCVAAIGFLLGRSAPNVFIFCDFALPPVVFLLLYAICRRLGARRWVAMAAGVMCLVAHDKTTLPIALAANPSLKYLADKLDLFSCVRPLEFSRLCIPQAGFIFAASAILLLLALRDQPRPRRAILAGLLFGSTFYVYAFYWTFIFVGGGLLALASLVTRNARRAAPLLFLALAVGLMIGSPVLYQALHPAGFSGKADLMARLSWGGRHVNWANQKHDLLLLALILLLYPRRRREWVPVFAFLLAPFVCILGARAIHMNTQDWHWLGRCWQPWSAVTVVLMLGAWVAWWEERRQVGGPSSPADAAAELQRAERRDARIFGALCALLLLYAANVHIRYSLQMAEAHVLPDGQREMNRQLRLRASPESVVLCLNADVLALIPVYSHCNIFLPYCIMSSAPTSEIIDRAAVALAYYGVGEGAMTRLLQYPRGRPWEDIVMHRDNREDLANWLFHLTLPQGGTPPEAEKEIRARAKFYGPNVLEEARKRYRIDYVWWGPLERTFGDPNQERKLARYLFAEAGPVRVYRLPPVATSAGVGQSSSAR